MKRLALVVLLLSTVALPARAADPSLLGAWVGTIVIGAATVSCTAQVLGDFYQNACESREGTFRFQGNGKPWRCFLPGEPQPPQAQPYDGEPVRECVAGLLFSD